MADMTDRESRQITFCVLLQDLIDSGQNTIYISKKNLIQLAEDLRAIRKEHNQLEDEVLALSSLILGDPYEQFREAQGRAPSPESL